MNKDLISNLHFEVEIKKLQYMFLKRDQLKELKIKAIDPANVTEIESINESCIRLVQKHLIECGYEDRLKKDELL